MSAGASSRKLPAGAAEPDVQLGDLSQPRCCFNPVACRRAGGLAATAFFQPRPPALPLGGSAGTTWQEPQASAAAPQRRGAARGGCRSGLVHFDKADDAQAALCVQIGHLQVRYVPSGALREGGLTSFVPCQAAGRTTERRSQSRCDVMLNGFQPAALRHGIRHHNAVGGAAEA